MKIHNLELREIKIKIEDIGPKMSKLRKTMNLAINRADSAPDRNEANPASLKAANEAVNAYNASVEEFRALNARLIVVLSKELAEIKKLVS